MTNPSAGCPIVSAPMQQNADARAAKASTWANGNMNAKNPSATAPAPNQNVRSEPCARAPISRLATPPTMPRVHAASIARKSAAPALLGSKALAPIHALFVFDFLEQHVGRRDGLARRQN